MDNDLSHYADSGRPAGVIDARIDLSTEISDFRHQLADTFPAQLTEEDHAAVQDLLATLARLIGEE